MRRQDEGMERLLERSIDIAQRKRQRVARERKLKEEKEILMSNSNSSDLGVLYGGAK